MARSAEEPPTPYNFLQSLPSLAADWHQGRIMNGLAAAHDVAAHLGLSIVAIEEIGGEEGFEPSVRSPNARRLRMSGQPWNGWRTAKIAME